MRRHDPCDGIPRKLGEQQGGHLLVTIPPRRRGVVTPVGAAGQKLNVG
jgi:hypothetical protein